MYERNCIYCLLFVLCQKQATIYFPQKFIAIAWCFPSHHYKAQITINTFTFTSRKTSFILILSSWVKDCTLHVEKNNKPLLKQWILCVSNPRPLLDIFIFVLYIFRCLYVLLHFLINLQMCINLFPRFREKLGVKTVKALKRNNNGVTHAAVDMLCALMCVSVILDINQMYSKSQHLYFGWIVDWSAMPGWDLVLHVPLQPMHDDYDLRQEQLNKASLLSSKKFLENLLEKFITNVVNFLWVC